MSEMTNMPRDYDNCVKGGGKIITRRVNSRQYMHICYLNGKAHAGEVKEYKSLSARKK